MDSYIETIKYIKTLDHLPELKFKQKKGKFSKVKKRELDNTIVAVKKIKDKGSDPNPTDIGIIKNFLREVILNIKGKHPTVINILGWNFFYFSKKNYIRYQPCIATEFCECGMLSDSLKELKQIDPKVSENNKFIQTQLYIYAYGIAAGMKHLHSLCILHRDLKMENIFLKFPNWEYGDIPPEIEPLFDEDKKYKIPVIADLGLSKISENVEQSMRCGTLYYLAPEAIKSKKYSFPADVFAYSIILSNILLFREIPTYGNNIDGKGTKIVDHVLNNGRPLINECTEAQQQYLNKLWEQKPSQRPKFDDIVSYLGNPQENFIFKNYDNEVIQAYKNYIDFKINHGSSQNKKCDIFEKYQIYEKTQEEYYRLEKQDISFLTEASYGNNTSNYFSSYSHIESEISTENTKPTKVNDYISAFISQYNKAENPIGATDQSNFYLEEGILSEKKKDFQTACEFYTKSIKLGNLSAVTKLGLLMLRSSSIKTRKGGYELLQYSAAQKEREGLYYYGYLIKEGFKPQNIPANKEAAAEKFIESGEEGHPKGFYQAGQIYHEIGIKLKKEGQNDKSRTSLMKAVEYYSKSYETYKDEESNRLSKELQNYLKKSETT